MWDDRRLGQQAHRYSIKTAKRTPTGEALNTTRPKCCKKFTKFQINLLYFSAVTLLMNSKSSFFVYNSPVICKFQAFCRFPYKLSSQEICQSSNDSYSYLEGSRFESHPRHRLSWGSSCFSPFQNSRSALTFYIPSSLLLTIDKQFHATQSNY